MGWKPSLIHCSMTLAGPKEEGVGCLMPSGIEGSRGIFHDHTQPYFSAHDGDIA